MPSLQRTLSACTRDAMSVCESPIAFKSGFLEGAIRTAIIRLEYDTPEHVAAFLEQSLEKVTDA